MAKNSLFHGEAFGFGFLDPRWSGCYREIRRLVRVARTPFAAMWPIYGVLTAILALLYKNSMHISECILKKIKIKQTTLQGNQHHRLVSLLPDCAAANA
jgi:hypothetical protein